MDGELVAVVQQRRVKGWGWGWGGGMWLWLWFAWSAEHAMLAHPTSVPACITNLSSVITVTHAARPSSPAASAKFLATLHQWGWRVG